MTGGFSGYSAVSKSFSAGGDANYSGTVMVFTQAAAPTGWTQDTTYNDYALRVTSGTPSTGGSVGFSSVYSNSTVAAGTAQNINLSSPVSGATTLTSDMIPSHRHSAPGSGYGTQGARSGAGPAFLVRYNPLVTGGAAAPGGGAAWGSQAHDHTLTLSSSGAFSASSAFSFGVKYINTIIASYNG